MQRFLLSKVLAAALVMLAAVAPGRTDPRAATDTPTLGLPLECRRGENCWVAHDVDVDPTDAARDFQCHARTYNGHDGIDVALRDRAVMMQGVRVIASAPGIVCRRRDGMEDLPLTAMNSRSRIKGPECGNGVVIGHDGGWEPQDGHLRQGTIRVADGQRVDRGTPLGFVGLSGKTEFPPVHLTVRRDGQGIDPFTGQQGRPGCSLGGRSLWVEDPPVLYEEVALYNVGFSSARPDPDAIRNGRRSHAPLPASSPVLALWVDMLGVTAGDRLRFEIFGPAGDHLFAQEEHVDRTQARRFAFAGFSLRGVTWPVGSYTGRVILTRNRDGQVVERSISVSAMVR